MKKIVFLSAFIAFALMFSDMPASAEMYRMELKFLSFVRYKGDLSHKMAPRNLGNPRNTSVIYKTFEINERNNIHVRIDDKGNFEGAYSVNAVNVVTDATVSYKISGKLSPDKKTILELSADYTFKVDVREEKWSLTLKDIPLHESSDFSDKKVFKYYIVGVDADCQLIPLNKHVVSFSNEHRFPDGGSVVLDELLLDKLICNLEALSEAGGLYNFMRNYQVPEITVVLRIDKDIKKPQQKKASGDKKKKR